MLPVNIAGRPVKKRLVHVTMFLFFLMNMLFILHQMWSIFTMEVSPKHIRNKSAVESHVEFPSKAEVMEMNNMHLFGRYQEEKDGSNSSGYKVGMHDITPELMAKVPDSALVGKISGLLYSDNAQKSLVIIESAGKQAAYGVGDRLSENNAIILRILQDKILLNEKGYYTTLKFKE